MSTQEKTIEYNIAQLCYVQLRKKKTFLEWSRGTGKSFILSRGISDCVKQMPRSSGVLVAETYAQILTRTLPSTIAGLEAHGYYKDLHFFVGRRPPKSWGWPEPYEPPLDYKNCVIFWNGAVMNFVSQDKSSSGRGLNTDWVAGDEAARLNKKKFDTDVLLTNRGNMKRIAHYPDGSWKYFEDCELHHSILLASSTPVTSDGMWVLDIQKEALLSPSNVFFLRASAEINRKNLGDDYFTNAKASMPDFLYEAEVLNKRIKRIDDGFYPLLDEEVHCYNEYDYSKAEHVNISCEGDADLDKDKPLILGVDWGANINCMVVCQNDGDNEIRVIKNLYVKFPRIIDNLVDDEFAPYYKTHRNKTIYMHYDPTGNINQANSNKTFAEQIKEKFEAHGWVVILMTSNNYNVLHQDKFNLWNAMLKNVKGNYPAFKVNRSNCRELWISMTTAPAKQGRTEAIKKDKSSEKKKSKVPQEHATHFSDAMDLVIVGLYLDRMLGAPEFIPTQIL